MSSKKYIIVAVIVIIILTVTALISFIYLKDSVKKETIRYITDDGKLRTELIERWLRRRKENGESIRSNRLIIDEIEQILVDKTNAGLKDNIRGWMASLINEYDYKSVLLLDKDLKKTGLAQGSVQDQNYIHNVVYENALSEDKVYFEDFHQNLLNGEIHIEIIVPLKKTTSNRRLGLLILEIDPMNSIYHFLTLTGKEKSREVLLVKQDSDSVLFLSGLQKVKTSPLKFKVSINDTDVIGVKAVKGLTGIIEGVDYKKDEALAYVTDINGSEWKLITKIDTKEIYYAINRDGILFLLIVILVITGLFTVAIILRRNEEKKRLSKELTREKEKSELLEHVDHLIMNANEIIMTLAEDGSILNANRKAQKKYAYSREEITKLNIRDLRKPETLGEVQKQLDEIKAGNGLVFETVHKTKDGKEFPVEISSRYIKLAQKGYFENIIRDITERKVWEAKLKSANRLYTVLSQVNQSIVRSKEKEMLFKTICDVIIDFGKYRLAWIGKIEGEQIIPVVASGNAIHFIDSLKVSINEDEYSKGPTGRSYKEGQCVIINNLETDELKPWSDGNTKYKLKSVAAVPLKLFGKIINTLTICTSEDYIFNNDDKDLIEEIAMDISFALERYDVEERESALKEAQRETLQKYRTLVETSHDLIFVVDVQGRITEMSYTSEEILGYAPFEMVGKSFFEFAVAEDIEMALSTFRDIINNDEELINFESRIKSKFGNVVYLRTNAFLLKNESGEITGIIGASKNITHEVLATRKLKESEKRFRKLAENAKDIVFRYSLNPPSIEYVSPSVENITGYSAEEFYNNYLLSKEIIHPDDLENLTKAASVTFKDNELPVTRLIRKDGAIVWLELQFYSEFDENGKFTALEGIARDVTERIKHSQELLLAKNRAEEANRLKSSFLANMSHELRTPMVGIMGYSELLKDTGHDSEQKEMADQLLKSSRRLNETLNSILDLSKIEAEAVDYVLEPIDANKIVKECIRSYEIVASAKGVDLSFNSYKEELFVIGDETLLYRVIDNLISNAMKFTSKGSIKIESTANTHNAMIEVKDTGVGIHKDNLDLIFEPFRQVSEGYSREFEGTGLGLTITKKYINLMGGEINVSSELNKGSVFTISLNSAKEKHEKIKMEKEELSENSSELKKAKILYVEDDDISFNVLKLMLAKEYDITRVITGEEAIDSAKKNLFDVILMDISLRGQMDGIEATKEIRRIKSCKNVPVIAITALAMSGDRERFLSQGCSGYLSKPYNKKDLKDVINNALKSKL